MKKIWVVLLVLLLTGCDLATSTDTSEQTTDITTTNIEVTSYSADDTYSERDYSEFEGLHITNPSAQLSQEEEIYYIYYYGLVCGTCILIKNEVLSKIELLENDVVYFVEVSGLADINDNINVKYTPSLVRIEAGVATNIYIGFPDIMNIIDSLS